MNTRTIAAINGKRHEDYEDTIKVANFAEKVVTGEGYGELVVNYKPRETMLQKQQRVEITNCASKAISGKIEGFYKRPFRMDKIRFHVEPKNEADKPRLLPYLDKFGDNGESLLVWCENIALILNQIDPNTFVWFAQAKTEDGRLEFNPVLFDADDVLDFEVNNGEIEWCVLKMCETVQYTKDEKPQSKTIELYYYFDKKGLEISLELDKDIQENSNYYDAFLIPSLNAISEDINKKTILTAFYPSEIGFVPVHRPGYKMDKTTDLKTFVTLWDNATELFKEQANRNSEYALSLALHVFLQKISYYSECDYKDAKMNSCKHGKLFPSNAECPSCKGSGRKVSTTTQDVIEIMLPDAENEQPMKISPRDLVHYVEMPMQIVEHQKTLVDSFPSKITEAVFGVDISHQNNQSTTATQVINYYDTAQDVIYEFTQSPRKLFLFAVKTIAAYLGIEVSAELIYPQQYDLESEQYLFGLLKAAKDSSASPEIIENITDRIVIKQNRIDGAKLQVYKLMRSHKPFSDLSNDVAMSYVLALPETDLRKVLYLNFKQIADEVYNTIPNFILLDFKQQAEKIKSVTQRFSSEAIAANSVLGVADITNSNTDIPVM